ncbi:MAG: Mrp/NBP35 family ATP-binding protein [Planctomycetota bacterium]
MNHEKSCHPHHSHEQDQQDEKRLMERMRAIKNKILVLSGKGGVGKSTVAVNVAVSLSLSGKKVGLLDIDIHGPSIPKLLHLEGISAKGDELGVHPVDYSPNLKVMSIAFMMQEQEEAVIWRGPMKHGVIKQFLAYVAWDELDYLVVDSPPGTGDEPLSIAQLLANQAQAIIVTTPQEIALADVRKSIAFCRKLSLPILGVIENMSGFACPHCNTLSEIFKSGGGEEMAKAMEVPFLGRIPIEPQIVLACDSGEPFIRNFAETATAKAFEKVIKPILKMSNA